LGREPGSSGRLDGIESGRLIGEPALRERIDQGVAAAQGLIGGLAPSDLEREVDTYNQGVITVRRALETFLVTHLEDHVAQLAELG